MRQDAEPVRLADYRPPEWLVDRVDLDVRLDPTATKVRSRLTLRPNPQGTPGAALVLAGDGLTPDSITLDGTPLASGDYVLSPAALTLPNPPLRPLVLEIETTIDPSGNTKLMGLYRSRGTYCTQCEAEGFRRITFFPDRPDVMAVFTTRIEADRAEAPVLLGNGNPVEAGEVPGTNRHYAVWHDPFPKPCYLFALVGGDLGKVERPFRTRSGRDVTLAIFVEHGREPLATYAMDALVRSMRWDEEAFGLEYDLDVFNIVAVSDFNMGAMENKGLNIFNDKYVLASPQTATDQDYANIEAIIAHEYFHNWTGNRITCRDWFQLCLKEGLTVFRDQEFSSDQRSRTVKRIADVRLLRAHQFAEDAGPLAHPVRPSVYREINNFYTATVYEKGAEVIRMLRTLIGPDAFRRGMDLYFERHDGRAATIEEFIACFAEAWGRPLDTFMRWYEQAGTPEIAVSTAYDTSRRTFTLDVAQVVPPTPGQPTKLPVPIPIALGLVGPDGRDVTLVLEGRGPVDRGVVVLEATSDRFVFTDVEARPVPSLLRGFSAPVRLTADVADADLRFLAARDPDPFNRWQSLQMLAGRILVSQTARVRAGAKPQFDHGLADAMAAILDDDRLEPALKAQALALPSEADIARDIATDVDPDAIFATRSALRGVVGAALADALGATYASLDDGSAYDPAAAQAGRRALKTIALDLLVAGAADRWLGRAVAQYRAADNMTDRFAALAIVALVAGPVREELIEDFGRRYAEDPLVLDKWFALQASIPERATLARVERLMGHAAFSIGNPNRVRALVGSFAQANPTQFNRADGAGYAFLAGVVTSLDKRNPQVAARLLGAFRSWRALEPVRRDAARTVLEKVAAIPDLSRDVADIVGRSLA